MCMGESTMKKTVILDCFPVLSSVQLLHTPFQLLFSLLPVFFLVTFILSNILCPAAWLVTVPSTPTSYAQNKALDRFMLKWRLL